MRTVPVLFLVCACNFDPGKLVIPPIPVIDGLALPLPKAADGKYVVMTVADAQLEVDPTVRDPLTAVGECVDQVTYCYAPGTRSLEDCVKAVKPCTTQQPWNELGCCPKQCQDDFAAEVKKASTPAAALDTVFFERHDCWPGLAAALEGK